MGKVEDEKNYTGHDARFSTYIWNSETKQFFGRTGTAWAKLTVFYLFFYLALAAFAGLCYHLFSYTLSEDEPKWTLDKSLIGTNPGLGYRPMPDPDYNADSTLIWFNKASATDASFWYEQLTEYIDNVEKPLLNIGTDDVVHCSYNDKSNKTTKDKSCRVETNAFGPCSKANNFGYTQGEPCILLKLNKIMKWEPDCYGIDEEGNYNRALLEKELKEKVEAGMPESLKDYIIRTVDSKPAAEKTRFVKTIWVTCEGEGKPDQENLGTLAYYPQQGIPGFYFPFYRQHGYTSPFVFAQFKNPTRGALINVECKAWARNIVHDRINRQGSVHFEILIDGDR